MPKILKSLLDADTSCLIRFFPVIMTHLLKLLVTTTSDDVSQNVVRVIIHILHSVHDVHKEDIALSYVEVSARGRVLAARIRFASINFVVLGGQYFFTGESVTSDFQKTTKSNNSYTLHEELVRALVSLLRTSSGENTLICNLLAHCWFFFQV